MGIAAQSASPTECAVTSMKDAFCEESSLRDDDGLAFEVGVLRTQHARLGVALCQR